MITIRSRDRGFRERTRYPMRLNRPLRVVGGGPARLRTRKQPCQTSNMERHELLLKSLHQEEYEVKQLQHVQDFQNIVGVILLLAAPISTHALSALLGIEADQLVRRLNLFKFAVDIPKDADQTVRILDPSLRDFLVQPTSEFHVDEPKKHGNIAQYCLDNMRCHLRRNICDLGSPGTCRADIDPDNLRLYLPPELQYSCRYWVHHLNRSHGVTLASDNILLFLKKHFLHWVEAMSLLGFISEVVEILGVLSTIIPVRIPAFHPFSPTLTEKEERQ